MGERHAPGARAAGRAARRQALAERRAEQPHALGQLGERRRAAARPPRPMPSSASTGAALQPRGEPATISATAATAPISAAPARPADRRASRAAAARRHGDQQRHHQRHEGGVEDRAGRPRPCRRRPPRGTADRACRGTPSRAAVASSRLLSTSAPSRLIGANSPPPFSAGARQAIERQRAADGDDQQQPG